MEKRYWIKAKRKDGKEYLSWPIFKDPQKAIELAKNQMQKGEITEAKVESIFTTETIWRSKNETKTK